LKTIKTLTKEPRKKQRNQKKKDQIEIIIIIEKNHLIDLNDKIESHKNFDKMEYKQNQKIKSRRTK
jgi:hypothetical protein